MDSNHQSDLRSMSAIGTKRTCRLPANVRFRGVKPTWHFALHMSAYDPKRTFGSTALHTEPIGAPFSSRELARSGPPAWPESISIAS